MNPSIWFLQTTPVVSFPPPETAPQAIAEHGRLTRPSKTACASTRPLQVSSHTLDDALPRYGVTEYVDLRTLIGSSSCTWCSNYFSDHGAGTKALTQLCAGPIAFAKFTKGEVSAGEALNSLKKNWLISDDFVTKAVGLLVNNRRKVGTGLFSLVERGGDITKEQAERLSRGTWHWVDGWSLVEHNEFDQWRKGAVLGFETSERARITSKFYAEVTSLVLEDPTDAWLAACVLNK